MKALKIIILLLSMSVVVFAQNGEDIIIGKKFTIHSDILGEDRAIWIRLPDGYESSSESFPVMYLLDGDGHFHHTTGIVDFMHDNEMIPDMIVVGIANTDRTRDMTPPLDEPDTLIARMSPTAGGTDNFLAFIRDELVPYIQKEYRAAPYKIMVGHSLGGLVAVHTLITQPELFNAYISISPSLWYGNQSFLIPAEKMLKSREQLKADFFMTMGNEGGNMLGGAMKLAALFEENPVKGFSFKFVPMPEETHGTVPHRSTYDGLEFIYSDYRPPLPTTYEEFMTARKNGGAEKLLSGVRDHYKYLSDKYGYAVSDESTINQLGYIFLQEKMMNEAVMAFEQNTQNHPDSPNAYDSLGDAYAAAGRTDDARKSYAKAVELSEKYGHPVGTFSAEKLANLPE